MGTLRYTWKDEVIPKSLAEEIFEDLTHLDTDEATRVTITDDLTGRSVSGAGADTDEALETACRKLGISPSDLDEELEDD